MTDEVRFFGMLTGCAGGFSGLPPESASNHHNIGWLDDRQMAFP
jgi:hypothetical protein